MEPFGVLGATAAIAQLVGLCVKSEEQARSLLSSFINAPKELDQLKTKLQRLRLDLENIQALGADLADANASHLLPSAHINLVDGCLQSSVTSLEGLKTLHNQLVSTSPGDLSVRQRLRWATLDKRKSKVILEELTECEAEIDVALNVLSVRLASLNAKSINAMRLSQEAFRHEFTNLGREITDCIQTRAVIITNEVAKASNSASHAIEIFRGEQMIASSGLDEKLTSVLSSQNSSNLLVDNLYRTNRVVVTELANLKRCIEDTPAKTAWPTSPSAEKIESKDETIPNQPQHPQHATSSLTDPDPTQAEEDMYSTMLMNKSQYEWTKTLKTYTWNYEQKEKPSQTTSRKPRPGVNTTLVSKQNMWTARAIVKAPLNIFGQRIIHTEIRIRHFARSWMSMPSVCPSLVVFNIRPLDAPIFEACRKSDLPRIRYLLETGRASINDVDEDQRGLLEMLIGNDPQRDGGISSQRYMCLQYLLTHGCNPNICHPLPASLEAFSCNQRITLSCLLQHGAQLDIFETSPVEYLDRGYQSEPHLDWQISILRSVGFSDWYPSESHPELLTAALRKRNTAEILFALECVKIDPNKRSAYDGLPIRITTSNDDIYSSSILVEYGAKLDGKHGNSKTPLIMTLKVQYNFEMTHWLLFRGSDPTMRDIYLLNSWHMFWTIILRQAGTEMQFLETEGTLSHLLLHGVDPHQLFLSKGPIHYVTDDSDNHDDHDGNPNFVPRKWFDCLSQIRATEVARACAYHKFISLRRSATIWLPPTRKDIQNSQLAVTYEMADSKREPSFGASWSSSGAIFWPGLPEEGNRVRQLPPKGRAEAFRGTTLFHETIATPEDRRRLSRFPHVCLLANALQLAGYRAEMDDEGDVWWEDEDGDRYFDARESQPSDHEDDGDVANCPICQDPAKYGLSYIFEEEERAKRTVREYKEKIRNQEKKYFY